MATTKAEAGKDYSAGAYLIVPDAERPSTWKLRVEEEPGKVTVAQLGRATAALTKGFRGRKVRATDEQKAAARKKLLQQYKALGADAPADLTDSGGDDPGESDDSTPMAGSEPGTVQAADPPEEVSQSDVGNAIEHALTGGLDMACWMPGTPWLCEVFETYCIVRLGDKCLQYPYAIRQVNGEAVATLGMPIPVKQVWQPQEPAAASDTTGRGGQDDRAPGDAPGFVPDRGTHAFVTDLRGLVFAEGSPTVAIEVCRDGTWQHPKFGEIKVTPGMRESFLANFRSNVRKVGELPLDYDHEPGPAPGWVANLRSEGRSLLADVRLTPAGQERIRNGEYRFFSPEWHPNWEDPETGRKHGPTLFGGGLTNKPFFRGMAAVACSEPVPGGEWRVESGQPGPAGKMPALPGRNAMEETQTGQEPAMTAAQFLELQGRLTAVEAENASLRAREERATLGDTLGALRFSEGRATLAPASRTALVDALIGLPAEKRSAVVEALKGVQFAELGERGFMGTTPAAGADGLTATERDIVEKTARATGAKLEEAIQKFAETKAKRVAELRAAGTIS